MYHSFQLLLISVAFEQHERSVHSDVSMNKIIGTLVHVPYAVQREVIFPIHSRVMQQLLLTVQLMR